MLLVIARKFNDIYYAMSIPEWKTAKERVLFIISNGIPMEAFPHRSLFDKVIFIKYDGESVKNIISVISALKKIEIPKSKTLVLSNPVLVTNQYIIKHSAPETLIFIEDGSMNYSSFSPSKSHAKKALQAFIGISEKEVFNKIDFTYLFYPDKATFSFGTKRKLSLEKKIFPTVNDLDFIKDKKILVGQPLYNYGYLSLDAYNRLVNRAIKQLGIDLYVPHAFASSKEEINCRKLHLSDYNVTLEAIAAYHTFNLFSFGSTVLYSCKTINPDVKSVLLTTDEPGMEKLDTRFCASFCNDVVRIV